MNKKCKIGQNDSWPRSCATSRFRDILIEKAIEALRNCKIRLPTLLPNVNLKETIDKSTAHNNMDLSSLVCM